MIDQEDGLNRYLPLVLALALSATPSAMASDNPCSPTNPCAMDNPCNPCSMKENANFCNPCAIEGAGRSGRPGEAREGPTPIRPHAYGSFQQAADAGREM